MKSLYVFLFLMVGGCVSHEFTTANKELALAMACAECDKEKANFTWFQELLQKVETDPSYQGDVFMGKVDNRVLFILQPYVLSCMACKVYDCDGNEIHPDAALHEKLFSIMSEDNKIFSIVVN